MLSAPAGAYISRDNFNKRGNPEHIFINTFY